MKHLRKKIIDNAHCLARVSEDFLFEFSKPAEKSQIAWREKQIGRAIPEALKSLALQCASRIEVHWCVFPETKDLLGCVSEYDFCGDFSFNIYNFDFTNWNGWKESFDNWHNYSNSPPSYPFEALFPVFELGNGDVIATVVTGNDEGSVIYLDHEGGDGDWKRLAPTIEWFIDSVIDLGFPGLEWSSINLFYDEKLQRISTTTDFAEEWRQKLTLSTNKHNLN